MSHTSKIFEEAPVKVQNKNGFDLSHLNAGTSKTGQLVPVMCKLLPPNSDFTLGINMEVSLPPLATPFYGRVDAIVEGFVIYLSQLYGGWKQFISNNQGTMYPETQSGITENQGGYALPYFELNEASLNTANFLNLYERNENIYEYLGLRMDTGLAGADAVNLSLISALAYHFCWDTFYRNKNVTRTIFAVNPNTPTQGTTQNNRNVSLIHHSFYTDYPGAPRFAAEFSTDAELTFPDGISIFSTRQRNYSRDYFTAATLNPQQGRVSSLRFDVASDEGEAAFTIGSLRAANALQKFLETNNLSADYADMVRNRWGARPIDADFDEPYYLGRVVVPVYQHSVLQQNDTASEGNSPNPFVKSGALGARGASGGFKGEGSITEKFHVSSWAFVMCLFSLVPHAMYGGGLNRELTFRKLGDFPAPELQTIGNEAIYSYEVYTNSLLYDHNSVFGYIPRYSRFKYMDDEVHAELRPGRTLSSFVLQRRFDTVDPVKLTTSFLEIPQNALDSVFAVSTESMNLSCWYEIYFRFKVSMPLADFCIPTLGDIQDTHTQKTPIGGSRL